MGTNRWQEGCWAEKKHNSEKQTRQGAEIAAKIKNSHRKESDSLCQKWHVREEQNVGRENSRGKKKTLL